MSTGSSSTIPARPTKCAARQTSRPPRDGQIRFDRSRTGARGVRYLRLRRRGPLNTPRAIGPSGAKPPRRLRPWKLARRKESSFFIEESNMPECLKLRRCADDYQIWALRERGGRPVCRMDAGRLGYRGGREADGASDPTARPRGPGGGGAAAAGDGGHGRGSGGDPRRRVDRRGHPAAAADPGRDAARIIATVPSSIRSTSTNRANSASCTSTTTGRPLDLRARRRRVASL